MSLAPSNAASAAARAPTVFVPMCCDFVHVGHINILDKSAALGEVSVLLMTDHAMRQYKRNPAMPYMHRERIVASMKQVTRVVPCDGPQHYAPLCREHKPSFFVHGDDWKTGPQQTARDEVLRVMRGFGGKIIEPTYTPIVSSTQSQSDFNCTLSNSRHVGLLTRTVLNDIKRDVAVAAKETKLGRETLGRLLRGHELDGYSIDTASRLLSHFYPIPKRMMVADEDTSDGGAWFMTAVQTSDSQRVFDRQNANGDTTPYYKYMDTATSALSPFKPELIEELVEVADNDPMNPLVVMNKGHLLGQATYFIGPVNFYWTVRGKRMCRVMNTGDSCLITPYVPHSFTSRDLSQYTAIVAVTFAGCVREALPQLVHLRNDALTKCAGDMREPGGMRVSRIARYAELRGMDMASVAAKLEEDGRFDAEAVHKIMRGEIGDIQDAPAALGAVLGVPATEFIIEELEAQNEVVFATAPAGGDGGATKPGKYAFAHAAHMPDVGGFEWRLEAESTPEEDNSQFYRYVYNSGAVPIKIEWQEEELEGVKGSDGSCSSSGRRASVQSLDVGDSVVFKPFVCVRVTTQGAGGKLVVFKVPGCLTGELMKELATFAAEGRNRMTTAAVRWY